MMVSNNDLVFVVSLTLIQSSPLLEVLLSAKYKPENKTYFWITIFALLVFQRKLNLFPIVVIFITN